ncbi:hypothetical protein STEG23_021970, partial [Scotinomys teguina]
IHLSTFAAHFYEINQAPCQRREKLPKMQRLPPKNVYYYRCPDHRKNYVMSFAFCFDREDDIYQFAYCYPYTYTRFQHYLDSLQKRNMDYFFREQLGQSVHVLKIYPVLVTLLISSNYKKTKCDFYLLKDKHLKFSCCQDLEVD